MIYKLFTRLDHLDNWWVIPQPRYFRSQSYHKSMRELGSHHQQDGYILNRVLVLTFLFLKKKVMFRNSQSWNSVRLSISCMLTFFFQVWTQAVLLCSTQCRDTEKYYRTIIMNSGKQKLTYNNIDKEKIFWVVYVVIWSRFYLSHRSCQIRQLCHHDY